MKLAYIATLALGLGGQAVALSINLLPNKDAFKQLAVIRNMNEDSLQRRVKQMQDLIVEASEAVSHDYHGGPSIYYCNAECWDFIKDIEANCLVEEADATEETLMCMCRQVLLDEMNKCSTCLDEYQRSRIYSDASTEWQNVCDTLNDRLSKLETASSIFGSPSSSAASFSSSTTWEGIPTSLSHLGGIATIPHSMSISTHSIVNSTSVLGGTSPTNSSTQTTVPQQTSVTTNGTRRLSESTVRGGLIALLVFGLFSR